MDPEVPGLDLELWGEAGDSGGGHGSRSSRLEDGNRFAEPTSQPSSKNTGVSISLHYLRQCAQAWVSYVASGLECEGLFGICPDISIAGKVRPEMVQRLPC